jgi:hypothetical protein
MMPHFSKTIVKIDETHETSTGIKKLLYSRKDAAFALSISTRSLDYLIERGELMTRKLSKKILIPAGELSRFARADHFGPVRGAGIDLEDSVAA